MIAVPKPLSLTSSKLITSAAAGWIQKVAPASNASADTPSQDKQERIEVTGSHIRRTDTEGVAPVETVTHQDLQKKAYDNLGDVVRDLGVNTFGSGTVSGPERSSWGSLLELTARGSEPIALPSGEKRGFIEDGDEIIFRGFCAKAGYPRIGFGECRAIVLPAQ